MANINLNVDNIETSNPNGIVGYSTSYISLQAVDGIYLNGIGPGNSPQKDLPTEITDNKGNFYISGQNGEAVIKSMDNGSIHLDSAKGNVTINVPNGSLNTNAKAVTGFVYGDSTTKTNGNITSITEKSSNSIVLGASTSTVVGQNLSLSVGDSTTLVFGPNTSATLGGSLNFCILENLSFNVGFVQTVNLAASYTIDPQATKIAASDLAAHTEEMRLVGQRIDTVATKIATAETDIITTGTKIDTLVTKIQNCETTITSHGTKIEDAITKINDATMIVYL